MPRKHLLYRRFDISLPSAGHREQVLRLKLEAWSPIAGMQTWIGWQGGIAHVWAWDPSTLPESPQAGETALPESVLYAPPKANELRLLACIEGYEGQVWKEGVLLSTRYWDAIPSQTEWSMFLRGSGQTAESRPAPEKPELLSRPWARGQFSGRSWWLRNERALAASVAVALGLMLGLQVGGYWRMLSAVEDQREALDKLRASSSSQLQQRSEALQQRDQLMAMVELLRQDLALAMLDQVVANLPADARILQWQHRVDELQLVIAGAGATPDPAEIVRALEQIPLLEDVLAERSRRPNSLQVRASVRPDRKVEE